MSKKVFVGNLPFQTTEDDLKNLFTQIGAVESVRVIKDIASGRSKGFGFVEMSDDNAEKAIAHFNGSQFNGRPLTVSHARTLDRKDFLSRRGGQRNRGGYGPFN